MKTYNIPQVIQRWGINKVKANSLAEAVVLAYQQLPKATEYIEDSQETDYEGISLHNDNLSETDLVFIRSKGVLI